MAQQRFNSFNELLLKKDMGAGSEDPVNYGLLTEIFVYLRDKEIEESLKHLPAQEVKQIQDLLQTDAIRNRDENISLKNVESLVRKALTEIPEVTKRKIVVVLGPKSIQAKKQADRIKLLSKKYQPNDPEEQKAELQARIRTIEEEIIEIEMTLMTLEKDDLQHSPAFKKSSDARERKKQLMNKLQKEVKSVDHSAKKSG